MNLFNKHLVLSASTDILQEKTLAIFKNFFNEEISLEGDWGVDLCEIIFPSGINQINSTRIIKYSYAGNKNYQRSIKSGAVSKPYKGETVLINAESYENLDHLIKAIKTANGLTKLSHQHSKITGVLVLFFGSSSLRNTEHFGLWRNQRWLKYSYRL